MTRQPWKWLPRLASLLVVAAFLIGAGIPLSSYLVNQGPFSPLGQNDVAMPDSDYTLSSTDYSGRAVRFTGAITADHNATVPLEKGITYEVTNATTGGHNILFGGSTGARATIPSSSTSTIAVHCPDGANFYVMSGGGGGGAGFDAAAYSGAPGYLYYDGGSLVWAPSSFTPGGDLDGSATAQYVVGVEGNPLDPATCRTPSGSSRMYWNGSTWTCAVPTLSGDLSGTASSNTFPGTVLSATGAAGNPYDAGGTFFVNQASGECLAGVDAGFCAQQGYVVFSDATSWQTIVERQALPNRPMDFYLIFDAWDYSGDGGSITKNNVTFSLEAHVATDSSGTPFFSPQAGADFGPGPIALAPLKNGGVSGCTTNNSDAGCTPSGGAVTTWTAQILNGGGSPPVARIQVKAVGTTRWPWHGSAMMNEQRFAP